MPPDDDRKHDTDPLADTAAPGLGGDPSEPPIDSSADAAATATRKRRAVHVGDVVGRYELVEDVGEGGMATVYRAKDRELRREVAIKVMFPHLARRPEIVRRFHREARAAAGLEHPNILRVYDVGGDDADDPPFIVMELVRGSTLLGEIEQRGPMFAEVCACVGALLADALAAAHQAGIIHRDIKPANVLIAPVGRLLLADFGVARLETEDSLVTKTGALLGTPAYMSPEQASGDVATARSDLYSLGATLYQLATGSLPYTGSPAKVMAQLAMGQRIPAVKKRAEVGPELSRVIDRLMAIDPLQRPASAKLVAEELRAIATAGGFGDPADELKAYFTDPEAFVRAKTPGVVTATVAAAKQAIAESKLPRAMALAERASALAPDDPAVVALVEAVTEGGRANQRRRLLVIGMLGVAMIGGGAAVGYAVTHRGSSAPALADAAAPIVMVADAQPAAPDVAPIVVVADATVDALVARAHDAGPRRDASAAVALAADAGIAFDATVPVAVVADAAPDAPPAMGAIVVKNDTWCDVSIDHGTSVRNTNAPFRVTAGHHVVTCEQSNVRSWTKEAEVHPNETVTVAGAMLGSVPVRLDVDTKLDGVLHPKGSSTVVSPGNHEIEVDGVRKFETFRTACAIRAVPELACYPLHP